MKVLVVGGGGREHSLVWKIGQSPEVEKLYCAPGNAGIAQIAECAPDLKATDIKGLASYALAKGVNLTVVGPEVPLADGIVDYFTHLNQRIVGPTKIATTIESSKCYSKDFMQRHGIPTAEGTTADNAGDALSKAEHYFNMYGGVVIKADGLAAGKGVIPCKSLEEALSAIDTIMVKNDFGDAGNRVVIEEFLKGEEASFIVLTDGENVVPLASSQDHKPIYDGDRGPNTGGMGAYSPAPVVTEEVHQRIMEQIMIPIIQGMAAEDRPYKGVLYGGLMIKDGQPKVLEFNARLGDPENQPIVMRMIGDLVPLLEDSIDGRLGGKTIEWDPRAAVCVVMASGGYPGSYEKGKEIEGLGSVGRMKDVYVFHAGTKKDGQIWKTDGGRVLGVTALGEDVLEAQQRSYQAVKKIEWDGVYYRTDIAKRAIDRLAA